MRRIRAEGLEFLYFASAEEPMSEGLTVPKVSPFMLTHLPALSNVRMVVVPYALRPEQAEIYYLHWKDAPDLDELDRKVQEGTHTDEDFAPSILTTYQNTWCRSCKNQWHTLVVPPDTYIGLGDLHRRKMASRWKDVKSCPFCKASLGQIVLEILGAAARS
jgi:hypothetical protein